MGKISFNAIISRLEPPLSEKNLKCKCGGRIWRTGVGGFGEAESYICDSCPRIYASCYICDGDLHSYINGEREEAFCILETVN